MEEFKGTKGPWRFDDLDLKVKACDDANPKYQTVIAETNSKMDYSPGKRLQFYNSLLIASAPDLLEACMEFVRKVERGEAKSTKSYNQMKKAISKALGK